MLITPTGMGADDLRRRTTWSGWASTAPARGLEAVVGMALPPGAVPARPDLKAVVHTHSTHASTTWWRWPVATTCAARPTTCSAPKRCRRPWLQRCATAMPACWPRTAWWPPARTLAQAMKVDAEIESLCEVYLKALAVGEPAILNAEEMAAV
jgi:L-fuculose-phosphate aldolase